MAVDVSLNDGEVWRSVVGYQERRRNPAYTWELRETEPYYLDGYDEEIRYTVRGPYTRETPARVQAGRDAAEKAQETHWATNYDEREHKYRVVSVEVERTELAWQTCSRRDEAGKWEAAQ
ncbi:hypothetical protein [Streptomyces sp. NRRL S-378]|uniref:hypothetical protein n=1 Tax=Streptomyces sp. NRRL S-378 TaxID=1463904 RepID=UPI0004C7BA73|nr:hypothetical protein [Streptomyces sp. NRRL S-378]